MSNENPEKKAGNEGGGDDAAARIEAARSQAKAEGEEAGKKAAQERIGAILNCEEAAKRTKLANHLAFETSMSVEDAKKTLAAASEDKPEAAAAGAGPLAEAMALDTDKTAGAGGGGDEDDPATKSSKTVSRIVASHAKATNKQPAKK